jgi:hypothetical protein
MVTALIVRSRRIAELEAIRRIDVENVEDGSREAECRNPGRATDEAGERIEKR